MDVKATVERAAAELEPGGYLVQACELTGGVSASVFGLDLVTTTGDQRRVVFRQHQTGGFKGHARRVTACEFEVLTALHREGFAVPEPYLLGGGEGVTPYLLIEWVDGSTDVPPEHVPAALDQMAEFLVALHALNPFTLAMPTLERIEVPWPALAPYLPPTKTGDQLRWLLSTSEAIGEPNRPSLIHGDYWPGNILWQDHDLTDKRRGRRHPGEPDGLLAPTAAKAPGAPRHLLAAVIDWEDSCIGDPLADLATARVELLCQYGAEAMERFTERYLARQAETGPALWLESLPLWELYASASALSAMSNWDLPPDEEAHRRQLTEHFFEQAAHELLTP